VCGSNPLGQVLYTFELNDGFMLAALASMPSKHRQNGLYIYILCIIPLLHTFVFLLQYRAMAQTRSKSLRCLISFCEEAYGVSNLSIFLHLANVQ